MPEGVRKKREKRKDAEAGVHDYAGTGNSKENNRTYCGTIKCFDDARGYGFIKCEEAFEQFQNDVFIHRRQFNGWFVGDTVQFRVQVNARGQPQAIALHECGPSMQTAGDALEHHAANATDEADIFGCAGYANDRLHGFDSDDTACTLLGDIKLIDETKGWGFIRCEKVHAMCGRDVWASQSLIDGFCVGDQVRFSMRFNKEGKPTATEVLLQGLGTSARVEQPGGRDIVHQGTVKKIDADRGYGFLSCQELFDIYGSDVFASYKQIGGFAVGDHVTFVARVNKKGQPQAVDLTACGPLAEAANDGDPAEEEEGATTMTGTIKSFDADHRYGFISSPEAYEKYGRDVFLHSKQIKQFQPGDHVMFSVRINSQGHPQAYGLKEAPRTVAWLAGGDDDAPGVEGQEHVGEIKSFSSSHGYGFIECPSLREHYGRDVFIHQSQAEGLGVGDRVTFRVQVKRGQPRACDVAAVRAPSAPAQAARPEAAAQQRPGARCAVDRDRQLLRACASARAESVGTVEELLAAGADPNSRDVAGHTALMVSALNPRHGERKCRLLIESSADVYAKYRNSNMLEWARERINVRFAEYLEGLTNGKLVDYTMALDIPRDTD